MAIRLPLKTVLDNNNTTEQGAGPTSVAGGRAVAFVIPQDTDTITVKFQASVVAGGASATLQTTDDGGTTWYDVARTSIVSNANATTAQWLTVNTAGLGFQNTVPGQASTVGNTNTLISLGTTGSAAASSLGVNGFSGLPILSQQGRVFVRYTNAITSVISERVTVMTGSQSATA